MKKTITIILLLMIVFTLSSCADNSKEVQGTSVSEQSSYNNNEQFDLADEASNMTEVVVIEEDNNQFSNYDFTTEEEKYINSLYEQLNDKLVLSNNETASYTRRSVDINLLRLFYDGSNTILDCSYILPLNNVVQTFEVYYSVDDKGTLNELEDYSFEITNNNAQTIALTGYGKSDSEDVKIKNLCDLYSKYQIIKEQYYGDSQTDSSNESQLNDRQMTIFNTMLTNIEIWETTENIEKSLGIECTNCIMIKIWSFDDGTAEILCTYGIRTNKTYIGSNIAYFVGNGDVEMVDEKEKSILEQDLKNDSGCEWQITWNDSKKRSALSEYLLGK